MSLKLAGWQGLFKWINPLKQFDPLYKTMLGHNNKVRGPTILNLKEKIHSSSLGRDVHDYHMYIMNIMLIVRKIQDWSSSLLLVARGLLHIWDSGNLIFFFSDILHFSSLTPIPVPSLYLRALLFVNLFLSCVTI